MAIQAREYSVYNDLIQQVMQGDVQLPSLPSVTLRIRNALANPLTSHKQLVNLLIQDSSLSALLMKTAHSSFYKTLAPAKTLNDALNLLGRDTVDQLVMAHSVKSLFVMKSASLKQLFMESWQRQTVKTAVCILLTQCTKFKPTFLPVTACFLSELGALAIISAFAQLPHPPKREIYIQLCKTYAQPLSLLLIKKWQLDDVYFDIVRQTGNWLTEKAPTINALEIMNLALYHSLVIFSDTDSLPPIEQLPGYQNLPNKYQQLDEIGLLHIISQHEDSIAEYINNLR